MIIIVKYRQAREDSSVLLVLLPPPAKGNVDDLPRLGDTLQGVESLLEHSPLLGNVEGLPERMAEGPPQGDSPRRLDLLTVAPDDGNADRRNSPPFDLPLDQSDGLVADRSPGGEEHHVGTLFREEVRD